MRVVFGDHDRYGGSSDIEMLQALPLLLPVIATAGLAALAWGLHGIATLIGAQELQDQAARTTAVVIVCNLIGLGIPHLIMTSENPSPGDAMFGLLIVAIASVITLLSLAKTCRTIAIALRARHEPVAAYFT
jgi:hypothetical protein